MRESKRPYNEVLLLIIFLIILMLATHAWGEVKNLRVPIKVPGVDDTFLPPDIVEIRTYFITIVLGLLGFAAKEIYQAWNRSKDTTTEDLREINKNVNIILRHLSVIEEQLKNKPSRDEVTKELVDRVQREVQYVSKIQGR